MKILKRKKKIKNNYTPFRLDSLNGFLIGCKLLKNGEISVSYDKENCIYTEEQIINAVKSEIIPYVTKIIEEIEKG